MPLCKRTINLTMLDGVVCTKDNKLDWIEHEIGQLRQETST